MTNAENYYHSLLTFGIMPGLDRIKILLKRLGNPEKSLRCIHVAGTNGKGSVCSYIASVLKEAGFKTGLYTSPYIVDFRERIRLNGEMISENDLNSVTDIVKNEIEKLKNEDIIITEFEAVTAAAFLYFKLKCCDFAVLETGLGGRFDATNVIERPLVSVITAVSLDHVNILGNTVSEIAYEKCGIIKNNCPVVVAPQNFADTVKMIGEQCKIKNSKLIFAKTDDIVVLNENLFGTSFMYGGKKIITQLAGKHQTDNCVTALNVIDVLKEQGIYISEKAVTNGIKRTVNPARCEIVSEKPFVIFDGCHNEDSANALKNVIESYLANKKIYAVMGMMRDKDSDKILDLLLPYFSSVYTLTVSNPRSMKSSELADAVRKKGKAAESFGNELDALKTAVTNAGSQGVIIVCGSLYLCSDLYKYFKKDRENRFLV